jgi:uncharacterized membrane protein
MRGPAAPQGEGSAIVASPIVVVIVVMMLGATIYLWRTRYIRRRTAFITIVALTALLIIVGTSMYTAGS